MASHRQAIGGGQKKVPGLVFWAHSRQGEDGAMSTQTQAQPQ